MAKVKKKKEKTHRFLQHLEKIGFSNRLAVYVLLFLLIGLIGGFVLAYFSITRDYLGALACWTIVFTPIGTATSICLSRIVDKSKAENTVGGIKYDLALCEQAVPIETEEEVNVDSPMI